MKNIKNENIPHMPEAMRVMVEKEVAEQMKKKNDTKFFTKKTLIIILAATLACGTIACAGVRYYHMHSDKVAKYGAETKIELVSEAADQNSTQTIDISPAVYDMSYLPDGMQEQETGKYSYKDTPSQGGISIAFYGMDLGDDQFKVLDKNVVSSEDLLLDNEREAVYLELSALESSDVAFNKKMYISYPKLHYVLELFIGEDVSKEEAVKIAEGIQLSASSDKSDPHFITYQNWSDYLKASIESEETYTADCVQSIPKDRMNNTHNVGDTFALSKGGLEVMVSNVEYLDSVSSLDTKYMDENLIAAVDEKGKLKNTTLQYIQSGDGVNTVDTIVKTEDVEQKLVYITLTYKNATAQEMKNVLVVGTVMKIKEENDTYSIYQGEEPAEGDTWNRIENTGISAFPGSMSYFDFRGGERSNNYISDIQPGETATVHLGFAVTTKDMPYLYLNLSSMGESIEFMEEGLDIGYVDIRK